MGLVDEIKNAVKKSGTNKSKFIYFKAGTKVRIRFLTDMDNGRKITFHDSYSAGINVPCQETFGRECKYCEDDDLRTRDLYAWDVFDYESKEVKILLAAVNQCSPVPQLVSMFETYGTLVDRDYVIQKNGSAQNTTYSVVPMDKATFRNEKAKAFSSSKFYALLDAAYPVESEDEEDDEKPAKGKRPAAKKAGTKVPTKKSKDWEDEEVEDEAEAVDYYELTPRELYTLCIERDIDVPQKKTEKFYIARLEEYDANNAADEEEEDEWDE